MNNDIVIDVQGISKKYTIATDYQPDMLRDKIVELVKYPLRALRGHHKPKTKEYWALKNISFQVKKGEVLGIIGKNGAGKSTLLKILSRITDPTSGSITMQGRVSSLLEVGTGFNPELTGRENIFLNGAIIGMSKRTIISKFHEIVGFSEIGDFLDTPVKRYSSGMYVRLAFAVAAHLDTDILILDEVLAVGDAEFQKKCIKMITNLTESGKTIILVSHNITNIKTLCQRCILLDKSMITHDGPTSLVIDAYNKRSLTKSSKVTFSEDRALDISFKSAWLSDKDNNLSDKFKVSEPIYVWINFRANKEVNTAEISLQVTNSAGTNIVFINLSDLSGGKFYPLKKKSYISKIEIDKNFLIPDTYSLSMYSHYRGHRQIESKVNFTSFEVIEDNSQLASYGPAAKNLATVLSGAKWQIVEENK